MSGPEPIVEARGLDVYYGASHVLRGLDFTVRRAETVGLMGRNGMGKTTLIRAIMGLVADRRGALAIGGRDAIAARPHDIAQWGLAYVPEGRGVFSSLSVRENLIMAARPGRDGRRDWTFERVLETFPRLAERLSHGGAQLSGGEQQMLTIGRALMTNPDLLLLDEATEGLAPMIADEIWSIVARIRETGVATVVVDKNARAILALADRAALMVKGEFVFDGPAAELAADRTLLERHLGV